MVNRVIASDSYSCAIKLHAVVIRFLAPDMLEDITDLELCQDIVIDGEVDGGLRAYRVAISAGLHVFLRARAHAQGQHLADEAFRILEGDMAVTLREHPLVPYYLSILGEVPLAVFRGQRAAVALVEVALCHYCFLVKYTSHITNKSLLHIWNHLMRYR